MATVVPDGWQPAPDLAAELAAKHPNLNISQEAETFADWHGARGNRFVDHGKAFRNWCRKAAEWKSAKKNTPPPGIGTGGVPW